MAIFLPERTATAATSLTPREIVAELDKHVIGQGKAKRAVAIALRNRIRRQRLPADIAEDVTPKNILMIGPTGVGKTEIARRLARLAQSPFIKVEASKFTEVGYVGRDVESMVRDLVELSVDMVRAEKAEEVKDKARTAGEERLLDLLLPPTRQPAPGEDPAAIRDQASRTRERMREQLRDGRLDDRIVELDVQSTPMPSLETIAGTSVEEIGVNLKGTFLTCKHVIPVLRRRGGGAAHHPGTSRRAGPRRSCASLRPGTPCRRARSSRRRQRRRAPCSSAT